MRLIMTLAEFIYLAIIILIYLLRTGKNPTGLQTSKE
jgi:hypothetical protein